MKSLHHHPHRIQGSFPPKISEEEFNDFFKSDDNLDCYQGELTNEEILFMKFKILNVSMMTNRKT